jgi:hypothetical protein
MAAATSGAMLAAAGGGAGFGSVTATLANPLPVVQQGSSGSRVPRPFRHARHERISCLECHGTGERHATYLIKSARDCAGCHHDSTRQRPCSTCHSAELLPDSHRVAAYMSLAGNPAAERRLPFEHTRHVNPGTPVTCRDCHRAGVALARERECASCHAPHHRSAANCSACHTRPMNGVHTRDAHLSCAGSACHAAGAVPSPADSRTLCIVCHRAQANHEPGGRCASCHLIPGTGSGVTGDRERAS